MHSLEEVKINVFSSPHLPQRELLSILRGSNRVILAMKIDLLYSAFGTLHTLSFGQLFLFP